MKNSILFCVALVLAFLIGFFDRIGVAYGQYYDHLECFKVKDSLRLRGLLNFESHIGLDGGCRLQRAHHYCVPASKAVITASNGSDLINPLEFSTPVVERPFICYTITCPGRPVSDQVVTDQFGGPRTLQRLKPRFVCSPIKIGDCGNGDLEDSEECDDGNTENGDGCNGICLAEFCGDGLLNDEPNEECDDADLGGLECQDLGLGYTSGALGCNTNCLLDDSACTPTIPGGANKSLDLARLNNEYATIVDADQVGLDPVGDFTIEMWVKLASNPVGNAQLGLIGKWESQFSYSWMYENTLPPRFAVHISGNGSSAIERQINYTLQTETWIHLALVYEVSSGTVEIFVNGSGIGPLSGFPTPIIDSQASFFLGNRTPTAGDEWDGKIDEVRVWGEKRSQTDIAENMNNQIQGTATNLAAYWRFNGSYSDESSNGNTLTPVNGPAFSDDTPF